MFFVKGGKMNKLTKLLSVFIIAGAVGAGVAGVAGCKKDNGHSHSIDSTKWTDNEDGLTHDGYCSCGELMVDDEEHVTVNGVCIKCGALEGAEAVTITGVTVSATSNATAVAVEGKLKLKATVTGTGNYPQTVTWSSSDESKATVSDTGEVTGVAEGEVTITATSTRDTSKSGSITLTVAPKGSVIIIPDYETLVAQTDKLYNNDFETAAARLPDFSGTYGGTRGVYTAFAVNSDKAGATNETHYVKVEGGKAVQVNPAEGTAYTVVDFGVINGAVEGYVDVTLSEAANGMTFVQFIGSSEAKTNSEVFGIRTDGGEVKYRLDGGKTYVSASPAISTVTQMAVYFKYDSGKMTVAINGKFLCKDLETTITKLSGFRLASGDSNTRTVNADNLVICGAEMTADDYRPTAIANLDAEYAKYKLTGDDATHSTNGSLVTKAHADGVEAIGAAGTIGEISEAYADAVAAMKDVLADADIASAKAAAKAALAEKFPADNYSYAFADGSDDAKYNNQAEYLQEIGVIEGQIENGATTQSALDAIVANATISVGNNATQLEAKKSAVTGANGVIATYKATETAAIETTYPTQYANIGSIKDQAVTDVNAATSIEAVNEIIAEAKADIESELQSTTETPAQTIARYQGLLEAEGTKAKQGVTDEGKIAAVDAAVTAGKTAIANATQANAGTVYDAEKVKVQLAIPKYEAKATLLSDKNDAVAEIHGDSEAATTATTAVTGAYNDGVAAIEGATTKNAVDTALETAQTAIAGAITTLKATGFEVTLGTAGEKMSVKYGTELKLGDIFVTAYNVTAATYGGNPITAEAGVTVYGDITINVTTAEKSNYNSTEKWEGSTVAEATAVGGEGVVQDNGLYKLTVQASSTYVSTGVANNSSGKKFTTATIGGTAYANVINVGAVAAGGDNSATPIKIEVKDNLKTLKIYTLGAGANGTDNRPGSTYYVINDGEPTVVSGQAQAYELSNLKCGDVVKVYISNTSGSGGNLYLAKVEAAIDESKVEKTVHVTWKGAGAEGADLKVDYHYFTKVTLPEDEPEGNGKFTGWYDKTTGDKFEGGKLAAGSHIFEAKYEYNVKITYKVNEDDEEGIPLYIYAEDGDDLYKQLPVLDPKDGNAHSGWTYNGTAVDFDTIAIGTAANPAEYEFAPVYSDPTSIKVATITVTAPKDKDGEPITKVVAGKTIQLTATVTPDNAYNKAVTWSCTTEGVTISETGLVTVAKTVAAGTVTITATAKDTAEGETPVTGSITLTVEAAPNEDIYTCGEKDAEIAKNGSIDIATGVSVKATGNKWQVKEAAKTFSDINTTITHARVGKDIEVSNNRTGKITLTLYIMDASSGGGKKGTVGDITVDGSVLDTKSYTVVNDSKDAPDYAIVTIELAANAKATIKTANYMAVYAIVIA